MGSSVRRTGKTVDLAIGKALSNLGVDKSQVEIQVIDEGTKGIFGLIGSRDAVVEVRVKETKADLAIDFLHQVTTSMGLAVQIKVVSENTDNEQIVLNLIGDNLGILIGHRGSTLDSLQYLTSLVANRSIADGYVRIVLDAEGYRERRRKTLFQLAKRLAEKARTTGRKVVLEPMPPHERRIIHLALQEESNIKTYSEGNEPYRKVVIVAN